MIRYKFIFQRILLLAFCCLAILGFINYEIYSINQKEYARQVDIASDARKQIGLNLNLIKIAIQTNDYAMYNDNLMNLYENFSKVESLSFIENEQRPYLDSLRAYMMLLEDNKNLIIEMSSIYKAISAIRNTFRDNYSGKDAISREKLTKLGDEIEKLKIDEGDYTDSTILTVLDRVNGILTDIISGSNELAECIDNCYKDRIVGINDELAEKLKSFANQTESLNRDIENRFDFDTLEWLVHSVR